MVYWNIQSHRYVNSSGNVHVLSLAIKLFFSAAEVLSTYRLITLVFPVIIKYIWLGFLFITSTHMYNRISKRKLWNNYTVVKVKLRGRL